MTRVVRLRLAVFTVIAATAVTYTGVTYARLGDYVRPRGDEVTVDLATSGGLFEGAEVTFRGVPVGRVADLRLSRTGVDAVLRIDEDVDVPADVVASVHNRSAVGEQYVDLVPRSIGGPVISDGDRIARSSTTTPLPEETLLTNVDAFVTSVDRDDLRTVVDNLGVGLDGAGPRLQAILDGSDRILREATGALPATRALIRDASVVLGTQADGAQDIRAFSAQLAMLSDVVAQRDPQLRTVLRDGGPAAAELTALVRGLRQVTPGFLSAASAVMAMFRTNLAALEQALVAFPDSLAAGLVGVRNGQAQFTLATTPDPRSCQRGYLAPREWRSPRDVTIAPPRHDLGCREDDRVWRGSNRAP